MAVISFDPVIVRTEVALFAGSMEKVLASHDAEHPTGKNDSLDMLYEHLLEEIEELNEAWQDIKPGDISPTRLNQLMSECIDVANMCMMVSQKAYVIAGVNIYEDHPRP